jgi:hypothetical protein
VFNTVVFSQLQPAKCSLHVNRILLSELFGISSVYVRAFMYACVFIESTEQVADTEQLHYAGKGDLHRQQAVRMSSTETQDSPQQSPVVMRRKSSVRANPAFRKSEGSRLLMGSVEGHQRNRAESEGGPGRVGPVLTRKGYLYARLNLFSSVLLCDFMCFRYFHRATELHVHFFIINWLSYCLFFCVYCAGCLLLSLQREQFRESCSKIYSAEVLITLYYWPFKSLSTFIFSLPVHGYLIFSFVY